MSWYDQNPQKYIDLTESVDMSMTYSKIQKYLPQSGLIWDLGCGSGRDSHHFRSRGFDVVATDNSQPLLDLVQDSHSGIDWVWDDILEIKSRPQVDFIWACASLLHIEEQKLPQAFKNAVEALVRGGYFYCSFKLGEAQREKDGLIFTDLTEKRFKSIILTGNPELELVESWVSADKISTDRPSWINFVVRRR